jgi:hypothetical protein
MPIQFPYEINTISSEIRIDGLELDHNKSWFVWWYCGIFKNKRAGSQPHVLVAFREIVETSISDRVFHCRVLLTLLGKLRIGTIWKSGRCIGEIQFAQETFEVDFTQKKWNFDSFYDAFYNYYPEPYPLEIYPLAYVKDRNYLLNFPLPNGGKLEIPCLEFFLRCYGCSVELKRVLVTYPWHGDASIPDSRLYAPLWEAEEKGKWKVIYRKRLYKYDSIILAHAKYDHYTKYQLQSVYSQIEVQYDPEDKKPAFVKVAPWYQGKAFVTVRGIRFEENKSFLGLQILGYSEPDGFPIFSSRENTNLTGEPADDEDRGDAWTGMPQQIVTQPGQEIDLTGYDEPDHGSPSIEILNPEIIIIGKRRKLVEMIKPKADSSSGQKIPGSDVDKFSAGEQFGTNKGIGYASIHSPYVFESKGIIEDLWETFLYLHLKYMDIITSVDWFTFKNGFDSSGEPEFIALKPFDNNDDVSIDKKNWLYSDMENPRVRGVLVVRLIVNGTPVYFVEIQRRLKVTFGSSELEHSEESLTGMVFKLYNQGDLESWLKLLFNDIRYTKGVMLRLVGNCPGDAATYRHRRSQHETYPYEPTIHNALSKLGIKLK